MTGALKILRKIKLQKFSSITLEHSTVVDNWQKSLNNKANTPEGKSVVNQLNSLLNFYNNSGESEVLDSPDFNKYKSEV